MEKRIFSCLLIALLVISSCNLPSKERTRNAIKTCDFPIDPALESVLDENGGFLKMVNVVGGEHHPDVYLDMDSAIAEARQLHANSIILHVPLTYSSSTGRVAERGYVKQNMGEAIRQIHDAGLEPVVKFYLVEEGNRFGWSGEFGRAFNDDEWSAFFDSLFFTTSDYISAIDSLKDAQGQKMVRVIVILSELITVQQHDDFDGLIRSITSSYPGYAYTFQANFDVMRVDEDTFTHEEGKPQMLSSLSSNFYIPSSKQGYQTDYSTKMIYDFMINEWIANDQWIDDPVTDNRWLEKQEGVPMSNVFNLAHANDLPLLITEDGCGGNVVEPWLSVEVKEPNVVKRYMTAKFLALYKRGLETGCLKGYGAWAITDSTMPVFPPEDPRFTPIHNYRTSLEVTKEFFDDMQAFCIKHAPDIGQTPETFCTAQFPADTQNRIEPVPTESIPKPNSEAEQETTPTPVPAQTPDAQYYIPTGSETTVYEVFQSAGYCVDNKDLYFRSRKTWFESNFPDLGTFEGAAEQNTLILTSIRSGDKKLARFTGTCA